MAAGTTPVLPAKANIEQILDIILQLLNILEAIARIFGFSFGGN